MKEGYIPKEQRKKILLLSDDIRVHSGVATVAREIVIHTAHHFNWVNIGAAIKHPDQGKKLDLSDSTNKTAGIEDSSVILYPTDGYGNPDLIRQMIKLEKPDAIFLITDPRYFTWLFQIENEIRKKIPITYLNIWDNYPAPMYNKPYYESCDLLMGISKQTVNINRIVLGEKAEEKILKYIPHGLNHKIFHPIEEDNKQLKDFKNRVFSGDKVDFALFFNSRNIRRKQIPNTMLAFKYFLDSLPKNKAKKCKLVMHTDLVTDQGTDLPVVAEYIFGKEYKNNWIISSQKLSPEELNLLYNSCDAQILLSNAEGWGLSLTEAMLVGNPIIANVTGGMQDQMRFEDENGNWIEFDSEFPSNHTGKYKKCGDWAFPVFPANRTIVGSPPTPYIWDDNCNSEDAAEQIKAIYALGKEGRNKAGRKGREWAVSDEAGFTGEKMCNRVIEGLDELFDTWTPRSKYEFIDTDDYSLPELTHNLEY